MSWLRRRRRRKLLEAPVPDGWLDTLERCVPYARFLSQEERARLEDLTRIFIAEKSFEGAGGLELTDEIRMTIAAHACLLLIGRDGEPTDIDIFPELHSIVVYPEEFIAPLEEDQPDGTVYEGDEERYGESWAQGTIVLSWEDVRNGASDPSDGENVVIHEFAHQLDEESGESNGAPALPSAEMSAEWARVMTREFEEFSEKVDRNRRVLLDEYAAEDPAEFFAVLTEYFFERPKDLKSRHPKAYELLAQYFGQDPASRLDRRRAR